MHFLLAKQKAFDELRIGSVCGAFAARFFSNTSIIYPGAEKIRLSNEETRKRVRGERVVGYSCVAGILGTSGLIGSESKGRVSQYAFGIY